MYYMNPVYALSCVLLFITCAVSILVLGNASQQKLVIFALFLAAVGQYLAQSDYRPVIALSIIMTTCAIGVAAVAVATIALGL